MRTRIFLLCVILLGSFGIGGVQAQEVAYKSLTYKSVGATDLEMRIYSPDREKFEGARPAIVFFFGGGWVSGTITQFERQAEALCELGMVAVLADYRVANRQGTTPYECVKDAKSAVRYVRANAVALSVDPDRIATSGGSAGGHIATATALIESYNEESDDLSVSCVPNALVLFNPVVDNGPAGYGYERIGDNYKDFSPLHNIDSKTPPTLFMVGSQDDLIPVEMARYFAKSIERVGGRCDLTIYEGQKHGFFNGEAYKLVTLERAIEFLKSLEYILSD
ncbi:MAG: alpha/beta hydrolase [Rikenellaceae bacterium]